MKKAAILICAALAVACGGGAKDSVNTSTKDSAASTAVIPAPGSPDCPATGKWARCSLLYRLERSGIAPRVDSSGKPSVIVLSGEATVVKFGLNSVLDLYVYPDSAARVADDAKLDKKQFVTATAPQTIRREQTLIENNNVIAVLTSINDRLRERVSDAITAGAPQPKGK